MQHKYTKQPAIRPPPPFSSTKGPCGFAQSRIINLDVLWKSSRSSREFSEGKERLKAGKVRDWNIPLTRILMGGRFRSDLWMNGEGLSKRCSGKEEENGGKVSTLGGSLDCYSYCLWQFIYWTVIWVGGKRGEGASRRRCGKSILWKLSSDSE